MKPSVSVGCLLAISLIGACASAVKVSGKTRGDINCRITRKCSQGYEPVCGGDSRCAATFQNPCIFAQWVCENHRQDFRVLRNGPCPVITQPIQKLSPKPTQSPPLKPVPLPWPPVSENPTPHPQPHPQPPKQSYPQPLPWPQEPYPHPQPLPYPHPPPYPTQKPQPLPYPLFPPKPTEPFVPPPPPPNIDPIVWYDFCQQTRTIPIVSQFLSDYYGGAQITTDVPLINCDVQRRCSLENKPICGGTKKWSASFINNCYFESYACSVGKPYYQKLSDGRCPVIGQPEGEPQEPQCEKKPETKPLPHHSHPIIVENPKENLLPAEYVNLEIREEVTNTAAEQPIIIETGESGSLQLNEENTQLEIIEEETNLPVEEPQKSNPPSKPAREIPVAAPELENPPPEI